ncbi:MAG: glutaredoxin 3 [Deltaproteobacteria bacterium]|nr:glutaredoxin 3 [Deltaproteobacteria bacterium]
MKAVKVYTKNYCPYCTKAKILLTQKSVAFEEINLEKKDPDFAQKLFAQTGFRTVPQIFIGDECIGGCDELYELEEAGELDKKLA